MQLLIKKQWSWKDILATFEDPGRKRGQTSGTFVSDLSELKKTIVLCPMCQHAFNWRRHGYYNVTQFEHITCTGTCDGCHVYTNRGLFLIHEMNVDHCWMKIDERKKFRRLPGSPTR